MRTPLYDVHRSLGAKIVDFCGWEMPVQYRGVIHEHLAVRSRVGLFDVSHMGRIFIEGSEAESLLDYLSTNHISGKKDGTATYTVWCNAEGTCVDDLIVYRETSSKFFIIANAGNREKDLQHLQLYAKGKKVVIIDHFLEDGILALQGPHSVELIALFFPEARTLKPMHFIDTFYQGQKIAISHTGYTGEKGVEIFAPSKAIVDLWDALLKEGQAYGIEPIGLGARDKLRLEKGFALYGHEINETILPTESVSGWTVKWDKPNFLGKMALEKLERSPHKRTEYGIILQDKGIVREGYPVFKDHQQIGVVTSGTFSPSLSKAIAIVLVERNLKEGDSVEVQIRQSFCHAHVVELPFTRDWG